MERKSTFRLLVATLLLAVSAACGESLPFTRLDDVRGPYDGTGKAGEALFVCPLGNAGGWPICAYWSSRRTARSPLFGFGWSIPALEAHFVKLDERRWAFHQPDGFVRVFVPASRENRTQLSGGPAWTATLKTDNTIRVVADPHDGGTTSEFTFQQGRLVHMVCEEGDFEIRYSGRVAEKIVSRGKTVFEIVRKPELDGQILLRFNGGREQVVAVCRPATVFDLPDVGAAMLPKEETCLATLMVTNGRKTEFAYGGTVEEARFQVNDSLWKFNPFTRKVAEHDGWLYMVGDPQNEGDEPAITRCHRESGRREQHSYDRKNGIRLVELPDGSCQECRMFTSGPLAGRRARWIKVTRKDGTHVRTDFAYDETGRLVYRRVTTDGDTGGKEEHWFNEEGKPIRRRINEEEVPLE